MHPRWVPRHEGSVQFGCIGGDFRARDGADMPGTHAGPGDAPTCTKRAPTIADCPRSVFLGCMSGAGRRRKRQEGAGLGAGHLCLGPSPGAGPGTWVQDGCRDGSCWAGDRCTLVHWLVSPSGCTWGTIGSTGSISTGTACSTGSIRSRHKKRSLTMGNRHSATTAHRWPFRVLTILSTIHAEVKCTERWAQVSIALGSMHRCHQWALVSTEKGRSGTILTPLQDQARRRRGPHITGMGSVMAFMTEELHDFLKSRASQFFMNRWPIVYSTVPSHDVASILVPKHCVMFVPG